jgi:hypothetical protein
MSKKITMGALIVALVAASCALFTRYNGEAQEVVASSVLVDYRISGGMIGRNDHLTVMNDGRAVLSSTRGPATRFRLNGEVLEQLKAELARIDGPNDTAGPEAVPADAFVYSIDYAGHRVTFADPDVPEPIRSVSAILGDVILEHRSR